jgi:hypothetical protein
VLVAVYVADMPKIRVKPIRKFKDEVRDMRELGRHFIDEPWAVTNLLLLPEPRGNFREQQLGRMIKRLITAMMAVSLRYEAEAVPIIGELKRHLDVITKHYNRHRFALR